MSDSLMQKLMANMKVSFSPEVGLHDMVRQSGPEKAEKIFEHLWFTMIESLHNSGEDAPEQYDSPEKWEAIGWWENKMKSTFDLVVGHAIFDAYDGQVPQPKEV